MGIILVAALLISLPAFAAVNNFPYLESFETGFGVWQPDASNDFNWLRNTGQTVSSGTGPLGAYDGEWYIYTEASSHNPSNVFALDAEFDFSELTNPGMTFYYFMYGNDMGSLHVDVYTGSWVLSVWSLAGQQQTSESDPWRKATIDLSGYAGMPNVILRIRGITGDGFTSDMCVDKVKVFDDVPRIDTDPMNQSGSGIPGENVNYSVTLINKTLTDTSFNISYISDPWNTLGPVNTGVITNNGSEMFTVQIQIPSGVIAGDQATSTVQIVSSDNMFTGTAQIVTVATWTDHPLPCETWDTFPHGWINYSFVIPSPTWEQIGFGNPAPGLDHPKTPSVVTNWFISPPIDLSDSFPEKLFLQFDEQISYSIEYDYTGVLISDGNGNPASNDFVELLDLYDDSGNWVTKKIDVTSYKGMNPVYIAFLYIGSNAHEVVIDNVCVMGNKFGIDNSYFVSPASAVVECSQATTTFRGSLYINGETGPAGPAADISAEVGVGIPGTNPGDNFNWIWNPASYVGPDGNYDAFEAMPAIDAAGEFDVAYRYRIGEAAWTYADMDGSSNGYDSVRAGKLTILRQSPGELIYEQTLENPGFIFPATMFSNDMPILSYNVADDFDMPVKADIQTLRWQGAYSPSSSRDKVLGFNVRFYSNEGSNAFYVSDHPGSVLYSDFYPGLACEKLVENNLYQYQLQLSSPFHVSNTGKYWFSIQMVSLDNDTSWFITTTRTPIAGSAALYTTDTNWFSIGADLGIEFYGSYTNAGILSGTVTAAHSGEPIRGAVIDAVGPTNLSTVTESDGTYKIPLPLGTYDIYSAARNYVTGEVSDVSFTTSGQTAIEDFSLVGSLLTYGPPQIEEILYVGEIVTNTVTVTNSGPRDINYRVSLASGFASTSGYVSLSSSLSKPVSLSPSDGMFERGTAPVSIGAPPSVALMEKESRNGNFEKRRAGVPVRDFSTGSTSMPHWEVRLTSPADTSSAENVILGIPTGPLAYGTESPNYTLISFYTETPDADTVVGSPDVNAIWASDFLPADLNTLYALDEVNNFLAINPVDASSIMLGTSILSPGFIWSGLAGDPDGTLYASATSIAKSELYTINPADGTSALIGTISNSPACIAIAINSEGEMYGYDIVNDSLISINKITGAGTIIGSLGFDANFAQGMDFDYETDILYLAAFNNGTFQPELRIADITTGSTTNIGVFSVDQVGSMAVAVMSSPTWATVSTNQGSIAAGGIDTFEVIFDSNAVSNKGTYTAKLIFSGSFVNEVPHMPLTMHIADGPMLSAPSQIDFGAVHVNVISNIPLLIKNAGYGVITGQLQNIVEPFGVNGTTNYILPSLNSTELGTYFMPTGPGYFTNVISLTGGGGRSVMLTGSAAPTLKTTPDVVRFADTLLDETNTIVVLCQNVGNGVVTGDISGASMPFYLGCNTNYMLPSLDSTYVCIYFVPTTMGTHSTTLSLTGGGGVSLNVKGEGIPEPMGIWIIVGNFFFIILRENKK